MRVLHKGNTNGPQILIIGGIHAREYVTTPLVEMLFGAYVGKTGVWAVPCANPSGAALAKHGLKSIKSSRRRDFLLKANGGNEDFSLWKANANAVDLNVNFDADWGAGASNVTYPAPENYIGPRPESEPETRALAALTKKVKPALTLSYHTKGEVIYWGFDGVFPFSEQSKLLADAIGYPLESSAGSAGGYKDWFVKTFRMPGFTVEVGADNLAHPIGEEHLPELYERNKAVLSAAEEIVNEIGTI